MGRLASTGVAALLALAAGAQAWDAPQYDGFWRVWQDSFDGAAGATPDAGRWNTITGNLGVNNELQTYSASPRNVQLSGGSTLQLVPWRDGSAPQGWTSGRLESKFVFSPAAGRLTRAEALLRVGGSGAAGKQGIWPAFWLLGDAIRHGVGWPACGELDVMEQVNGDPAGHGTMHCHVYPGGICNEGNGLGAAVALADRGQGWHTWRIEMDRRPANWADQTITWFLDGRAFHQIRGSRINDYAVWQSVCASPLYFLVNVAVGGNWVRRLAHPSSCFAR